MLPQLPEPIAGYFSAAKSADQNAIMRHFSPDAVVIDENRSHIGHAAIQLWMDESVKKYSFVAEPFDVADEGTLTVVTAHVTGNFPGSPVDLRYRFALDGDKIASLEIGV
jgi:ketosteroid isomerase-like protein